MWNRVANATGRTDMTVDSYASVLKFDNNGNTIPRSNTTGEPFHFTLPTPPYEINWDRTRKY